MSSSAWGGGGQIFCDRAPSGLPASSYFYTREKSNLTRSIAYGWNGGAFFGRRPKPTARKELAGNPGKRALNKEEPVFTPIKGVAAPEWFFEDDGLPMATIMWEMTTKELCGQGLLCVTDLAVLELWCSRL